MGNFHNPQVLSTVGIPAESVISKLESHKLCHAFEVKGGIKILKGEPVYLDPDASKNYVFPVNSIDLTKAVLVGIALTSTTDQPDGGPYKPQEVTVACRGYAIVKGMAGSDMNQDTLYVEPEGDGKYIAAINTPSPFILLTDDVQANDEISVLVL